MKLRNKKTWKIVERSGIVTLRRKISSCGSSLVEAEEFSSIEQLNEEWEDYKPAEPLIKDKKMRKVVRVWADANEVTKVYVYGIGDGKEYIELYAKDDGVVDGKIRISLPTQDGVRIGEEYAIAELCGEEEEIGRSKK